MEDDQIVPAAARPGVDAGGAGRSAVRQRSTSPGASLGGCRLNSFCTPLDTTSGDYRIVYEIEEEKVTVWAIRHRKDVYEEAELRWLSA